MKNLSKRKSTAKKEETMEEFYDKWEAWARKRTAWTQYAAEMHNIKMQTDEKYRKAINKSHPKMYIG